MSGTAILLFSQRDERGKREGIDGRVEVNVRRDFSPCIKGGEGITSREIIKLLSSVPFYFGEKESKKWMQIEKHRR